MRISDWSSDVCSSDLDPAVEGGTAGGADSGEGAGVPGPQDLVERSRTGGGAEPYRRPLHAGRPDDLAGGHPGGAARPAEGQRPPDHHRGDPATVRPALQHPDRLHALGTAPGVGRHATPGGDDPGPDANPEAATEVRPTV